MTEFEWFSQTIQNQLKLGYETLGV